MIPGSGDWHWAEDVRRHGAVSAVFPEEGGMEDSERHDVRESMERRDSWLEDAERQ